MCPNYGGGIVEFECIGFNSTLTKNDTFLFNNINPYPTDLDTLGLMKEDLVI